MFEKFENRLDDQKGGLPNFTGLAEPADPWWGFRQCKFWVFQNQTPRNRRNPQLGSVRVFPGFRQYVHKIICLFFLIPQLIKHQINLFSEKHPSKLPITTKESFFSPQQVENHFPPEFKFKNNPMNLSTKGRNPLVSSLTSVVS